MTFDEAEKELQDKIDKLTDTLYSQLGISKDMLTETATECDIRGNGRISAESNISFIRLMCEIRYFRTLTDFLLKRRM